MHIKSIKRLTNPRLCLHVSCKKVLSIQMKIALLATPIVDYLTRVKGHFTITKYDAVKISRIQT